MKIKVSLLLLTLLVLASACEAIVNATDSIAGRSARDKYHRTFFAGDSIYDQWHSKFVMAQGDSLTVELPYAERSLLAPNHMSVFAYSVMLRKGEVLHVEVLTDSAEVFIDILSENKRIVASSEKDSLGLKFAVEKTGTYNFVIQPGYGAVGKLSVKAFSVPQFAFPVEGKGNSSIGSFWSDIRDGGRRRHEGIDIFAKKGTPVLAVTEGVITYSGEKGLGGKQVWQRSSANRASVYYAHLDSITAEPGSIARAGDVLGYVGIPVMQRLPRHICILEYIPCPEPLIRCLLY